MIDPTWIGLDRGDTDVATAEHLVSDLAPELLAIASLACTHLVGDPYGHYAVSLEIRRPLTPTEQSALINVANTAPCALSIDSERLLVAGDPDLQGGAMLAAAGLRERSNGRAFRYAGEERLRGVLSVDVLLDQTAIDRVDVLGGVLSTRSSVQTRDFVRPQFRDGQLVLVVTPRAGDSFQPFEARNPHHCCEDHSA